MEPHRFSRLGLGTGAIGDLAVSHEAAFALMDAAYECGVTTFDSARSYGASEERIGEWLATRRADLCVTTKGGYGVDGVPEWTGEAITRGIDEALGRLRRGYVDVFFLHSCPLDVARKDDILRALGAAKTSGKIRAAGYSGEGDALAWAVHSGYFGVVQCSINPFDQTNTTLATEARTRGIDVFAKRALGNAPWRHASRPVGEYVEEYWARMRAMQFDPAPLPWDEYAIRFSAFAPGVTTALLGTRSRSNLEKAVHAIRKGALSADSYERCRAAFATFGAQWLGQV
jgi:aryl-alcohol dehydrogenase-like predicted oxidoreductase